VTAMDIAGLVIAALLVVYLGAALLYGERLR
jgi:hypothetical protein